MTNPATTLSVLRQGTKDYIAIDPIEIALIPSVATRTASGSTVYEDGTPRAVQTFKLITLEFTPRERQPVVTQDGVERIIGAYLLGAWDCVMQPRDHWIGADGRRYEVVALMDGHGYETKGAVEAHG